MGGWHLRMTWSQEVCYASLHSEPASALGLLTVWSLWGNQGMARCWEMSTLPAAYSDIGQQKWVTEFHCMWSVVRWLIVYQDGDYLYPGQYSQALCWSQIGWYCLPGGKSLMARPSTFLEHRSLWGHECWKYIYLSTLISLSLSKVEQVMWPFRQSCPKLRY